MNTKSKSERECIRVVLLYISQALFQRLLALQTHFPRRREHPEQFLRMFGGLSWSVKLDET
jgi:hypothetical protein